MRRYYCLLPRLQCEKVQEGGELSPDPREGPWTRGMGLPRGAETARRPSSPIRVYTVNASLDEVYAIGYDLTTVQTSASFGSVHTT